jgi:hypothetical protein
MNKTARRSFIKGLIVLVAIFVGAIAYVEIQSQVKVSEQSRIGAEKYNVAVDYSGLVTQQLIKDGDFVEAGQELMYIKSSALLEDLNEKRVTEDDLLYPLSNKKEIIVKAQQSGKVEQVQFAEGSFVPANHTIFEILDVTKPYVESYFDLSNEEFSGLSEETELQVELPNGQRITSKILSIVIEEQEADEQSGKIRVLIQSEIDPNDTLLIGSPVTARLRLEEGSALEQITSKFKNIFGLAAR